MATSAHETEHTDAGEHHGDAQAAFIDRVAAKYEAEDAKQADADDGIEASGADDEAGEEQDEGGADDDDQGTEEHTEAGTSTDDSDGNADESEKDSTGDDDTDHTAGDESTESATGDEATDGDDSTETTEEDEVEEDPASDATKAALTARGADLTLTDVPTEYRGIVEKKLRNVDAAFTRIQQEAATFRSERAKFVAEERFRAENPHLAIVEAIQAGGDELFEKVNEELGKLGDSTLAEAFKIVVKDKRQAMVQAVESERDKVEQEWRQWQERSQHVETTARAVATKAGLPWRIAERAIEAALLRKPENARDITDDEIQRVIADEAKEHTTIVREQTRAASKALVQTRTATRKAAPPSTGKRPASSASPRPAATKAKPVDYNSEESRQARMMESARRIAPGMKDG